MELADAIRQLEKAADVLADVETMMTAEATMNAAKHMSSTIRPNPLASAVSTVLDDVNRTIDLYRFKPQPPEPGSSMEGRDEEG